MIQDHAMDIAKAAPPVTVSAITLFGFWTIGACTQVTPPAQQATIPPVN